MTNLHEVDWSRIPAPIDDGAADHLEGARWPGLALPATDGRSIDLSALCGVCVVYIYPMTGRPGTSLPDGWDMIPGARGCTPQSCAFRDHFAELRALGVDHVFGLSTQSTDYQCEVVSRLHLPFPLLSDDRLALAETLHLPTFQVEGSRLLKRTTLIARDGEIIKVFFPVFPPDRSVHAVIDWLSMAMR